MDPGRSVLGLHFLLPLHIKSFPLANQQDAFIKKKKLLYGKSRVVRPLTADERNPPTMEKLCVSVLIPSQATADTTVVL